MHRDLFYHAFLIVIGLFSQPTLPKNPILDTSTAFYGFEFNPEAVPMWNPTLRKKLPRGQNYFLSS